MSNKITKDRIQKARMHVWDALSLLRSADDNLLPHQDRADESAKWAADELVEALRELTNCAG